LTRSLFISFGDLASTAHLSNLVTERVSDARSRNRLRIRAPRNEKHDLTHQLEKRLLHINAALGTRLKERHPKALGKGSPLLGRHLAIINEIALKEKREKEQASRATPALCVALCNAGSTKHTAGNAHLVTNKHDGHVVYTLHTQNLVYDL